MGGWEGDGWVSGAECKGESATAGGTSRRGEAGGDGAGSASAVAIVYVGSSAAAGISADVQSIHRRWALWHPCGYGDSRDGGDGAENQDGCFGYFVFVGAGGV